MTQQQSTVRIGVDVGGKTLPSLGASERQIDHPQVPTPTPLQSMYQNNQRHLEVS